MGGVHGAVAPRVSAEPRGGMRGAGMSEQDETTSEHTESAGEAAEWLELAIAAS